MQKKFILLSLLTLSGACKKTENDPLYVAVKPQLAMRSEAGTKGKILRQLPLDTKVKVLSRSEKSDEILGLFGKWAQVEADANTIGWVFEPLLRKDNDKFHFIVEDATAIRIEANVVMDKSVKALTDSAHYNDDALLEIVNRTEHSSCSGAIGMHKGGRVSAARDGSLEIRCRDMQAAQTYQVLDWQIFGEQLYLTAEVSIAPECHSERCDDSVKRLGRRKIHAQVMAEKGPGIFTGSIER